MKSLNILIIDDNFIIGDKIKQQFFKANQNYKSNTNINIYPYFLHSQNFEYKEFAIKINNYIKENNISYMLLDRNFGEIILPNNNDTLDNDFLYKKDSNDFKIEKLIEEIHKIPNNSLSKIKGIIVYTYAYLERNKNAVTIKSELKNRLEKYFSTKCKLEILLTYHEIYETTGISLYENYSDDFLQKKTNPYKIGLSNNFKLYGLFVGELLYHKIVQMSYLSKINFINDRKSATFLKLTILYLIFTSISIGGNAIYNYLFSKNLKLGIVVLLFGLIIPIVILALKPSILIDIED